MKTEGQAYRRLGWVYAWTRRERLHTRIPWRTVHCSIPLYIILCYPCLHHIIIYHVSVRYTIPCHGTVLQLQRVSRAWPDFTLGDATLPCIESSYTCRFVLIYVGRWHDMQNSVQMNSDADSLVPVSSLIVWSTCLWTCWLFLSYHFCNQCRIQIGTSRYQIYIRILNFNQSSVHGNQCRSLLQWQWCRLLRLRWQNTGVQLLQRCNKQPGTFGIGSLQASMMKNVMPCCCSANGWTFPT